MYRNASSAAKPHIFNSRNDVYIGLSIQKIFADHPQNLNKYRSQDILFSVEFAIDETIVIVTADAE